MKFLKSIPLLFLGLMAAVAPLNTAHADDSVMDDGIGQVVNVAKNTTDALKDASTSIADFMAKTTDEKALDILVASLKKAGMNPTWAKQIGSLRKFSSVAKGASKIAKSLFKALQLGEHVAQIENSWNDRAAFSKVAADIMTEMAAEALGGLVSKVIKAQFGTAIVAAGTTIAPGVGTIVAAGGVWVMGWVAGKLVEKGVEKVADIEVIRKAMEEIGGAIWDYFHHGSGESDDRESREPEDGGNGQVCRPGDDPFDTEPTDGNPKGGGNGPSRTGYQGIKGIQVFRQ